MAPLPTDTTVKPATSLQKQTLWLDMRLCCPCPVAHRGMWLKAAEPRLLLLITSSTSPQFNTCVFRPPQTLMHALPPS